MNILKIYRQKFIAARDLRRLKKQVAKAHREAMVMHMSLQKAKRRDEKYLYMWEQRYDYARNDFMYQWSKLPEDTRWKFLAHLNRWEYKWWPDQ